MSAQSVMSVILPAASTAAGLAVSDDTAADGVLFAAMVAEVSGGQDGAAPTADAAPAASVEAAASDSDASATDPAVPAWPPVATFVPIIPPAPPTVPAVETPDGAPLNGAASNAPAVPPMEPLETTPSPAPTGSSDAQPSPAPAPAMDEAAKPAEDPASSSTQDAAPAPSPATEDGQPTVARPQATPALPTAPLMALSAALAGNRAAAALASTTTEAAAPAAPTEDASAKAPASPSTAPQTAPPAQAAAAPTPAPVAPRLREAPGRSEDHASNAAADSAPDSALASGPSATASAASTSNGAATAASFASASTGADRTAALPAPAGDVPATADGDTAAPAALPPLETQAGAPAANRDLGLSMLSRATVETTAQIAAQIIKKLDGRSTRFDMALTPDDLGRVDVSMEIDSDGRLTARLAFDNPAAATDLRGRADELRRQLQDAGFHLSQDSLEFSERNPSSGFGGGAFDRPPDRRAFTGAARLAADADLAVPPAGAWTSLSLTPDRVDLKV